MTEDDARECREGLTKILIDHALSWIVQQAEERMLLGKTTSKHVQESVQLVGVSGGEARRGRRRTAEFLTTEPFTESEKLLVLLDAIEWALVSPPRMQREMIENLGIDERRISFVPEDTAHSPHGFARDELVKPAEIAQRLEEAVRRVRELAR